MDIDQKSPVGTVAKSVAKAANLSGLLQAIAVGAMPVETVEGLLLAAEMTIVVQLAIGTLSMTEVDAIRTRIVKWSRDLVERMEADGTAEQIRKQHADNLEEYRKTHQNGNDGIGPN